MSGSSDDAWAEPQEQLTKDSGEHGSGGKNQWREKQRRYEINYYSGSQTVGAAESPGRSGVGPQHLRSRQTSGVTLMLLSTTLKKHYSLLYEWGWMRWGVRGV